MWPPLARFRAHLNHSIEFMGWGGGGGGGAIKRGKSVVSLSRLLRKSTSGYIRVLPGRGEPPTSAQAHDRRPKNPEFNGKTVVDSWEPYKQDAATPHCSESPH